jgi:hypothetical protein
LLVVNYQLPNMTAMELMNTLRAAQPDVKVILVTDATGRKAREEMLKAGAVAIFNKPVPLADFLDVVERSLGLVRTIFPTDSNGSTAGGHARLSELLANFRQEHGAVAVLLLNDRGLVVARAGDLRDTSMEVSLVSALTATSNAGLKVAKSNRQEVLNQFSVFGGGDHDLILMPVDAAFSVLIAGDGLSGPDQLFDTVQAMRAMRDEVSRSLRSMGVGHDRSPTAPAHKGDTRTTEPVPDAMDVTATPELDALFKEAGSKKVGQEELDAFWDEAAALHANKPINSDVIPYEEARKLGLTPDEK